MSLIPTVIVKYISFKLRLIFNDDFECFLELVMNCFLLLRALVQWLERRRILRRRRWWGVVGGFL